MRYGAFLMALGLMWLSSCDKESPVTQPPPPPPVPPAILLKEITIPNLPSPHYHFDYKGSGAIDKALFASGFRSYDLVYDGSKIAEMQCTNAINKDKLQYVYDENGKVAMIKYINESNVVYKRVHLTFQGDQLKTIEWERKENAGYAAERTLAFVYRANGNLLEMTDHRYPLTGQDEATYESRFEEYDTKRNVDGFSLVHDNSDHLLLLPGVVLQKNNPSRLIFTGTGLNYTIDYTYSYSDKNVPLTKSGDGVFVSGPNAGQRFQTRASYSYY